MDENIPIYVLIGEVQKYLDKYYEDTGRYETLVHALESLYQLGKYTQMAENESDYNTWNIFDVNGLWEIFKMSKLNVRQILKYPNMFESFVSEDYIGFKQRDIVCNLHFRHELAVSHAHDYFELNYVLEGTLDIEINLKKNIMQCGDFCIIAANTQHIIRASDNAIAIVIALRKSTFQSAFFSIFKKEDILSDFFKNCLYSSKYSYLMFHMPPGQKIREIIKNIFSEASSDSRESNEIACSYLCIFFRMLLRTYSNTYLMNADEHSILSQMSAILIYLQNNYKTLTLEKLGKLFGYEAGYLGKQIHRTTGFYYNDIVTRLKINETCNLLKYSDKSMDEISKLVGYNSQQHFSRAFRKEKKISPSEFKKQYKD